MYTGSGFKYADSSRQTILWEVYQPTPESEKSVLRVSWRFEWISKPWVGSDSIKNTSTKKVVQTVAYIFKDYMPSKVRKFSNARDAARGEANLLKNISDLSDEISDLRTFMHH